MGLKTAYLALYNLGCAGLWAKVLYHCVQGKLGEEDYATIYDHSEETLKFVQTIALLEIVHALIGIVKSPVMTTAMQVASRILVVWGFLHQCPSTHGILGMFLALTSWSLVEVVRYTFYFINIFSPESMPSLLFWLRYSLFLVLYPSGISGEILIMLEGMRSPCMNETKLLGVIEPYYLCILALAIYVPGAPFMISNMWANRKRSFSKFFGKQKKGD